MALDKIFGNGDLDKVADSVFSAVSNSTSEIKAMQKRKAAENVQIVVQALKKIESDLQDKYDGVTTGIEKRVASIKNGKDGQNGVNGKDGRDGRPGRDGAAGQKGNDGMPGRNGIDGIDGVSVTNAFIDFDGSLIINLSSGQTLNVGEVVAPDLAEKIQVITNGGGTSQQVLDTLISLQNQINNLIPDQTGNAGKFLTTDGTDVSWGIAVGGLKFEGTWNASTNTPTLASGVGVNGEYYITDTAGATNLDGITDWEIGDWLLFNGTVWQKIDQSNLVSSVNGQVGVVSLTTTDIAEGTNLYYTDARARAAISAGTGISYDSATGVVTNAAPDQTVSLTGSGTTTISGTYPNFEISSTDANVGTVTSVSGTGAVSGISLSGTVTSSGSLTLGGSLDLSSPPTIGNTAPNTGAFTNLAYTGTLTGGTGVVNLGSGQLFKDASGNVGIGTSSPGAKLDVRGGKIQLIGAAGGGAGGGFLSGEVPSEFHIQSEDYTGATFADIVFDAGNGSGSYIERMRINSAGNVGIGTSSPNAKLVVAGGQQYITNVSAQAAGIEFAGNANTPTTTSLFVGQGSDSNGFVFQRANAPLIFATNNAERLRIDSAGNVGIGTSSPATSLHVLGSAVVSDRLFLQRASASLNLSIASYWNGSGSPLNGTRGDIVAIGNTGGDGLVFVNSDTERMRIDSAGNVGIGTSSPSRSLDIRRAFSAGEMGAFIKNTASSTTGNSSCLWFGTWENASTTDIYNAKISAINMEGSNARSDLAFFTYNGNGSLSGVLERMRIDSSGNLLVGTTVGAARLNVVGTTLSTAFGLTNGNCLFREIGNTAANNTVELHLRPDQGKSAYITFTENAISDRWSVGIQNANGDLRFLTGVGNSGTLRMRLSEGGALFNSTGTYGTISDARLKENVADATPKLDGLMQLRVVNYNLKSDPDIKMLGFVAQEVEQVFPGLVDSDGEMSEDGDRYKSVKTTVLIPMLIKAIQEQQAIIESLKARLDAANL